MTFAYDRQGVFRGWDRFDYFLIMAALALVAFGLTLIHSGSVAFYSGPVISFSNPVAKQALFAIIGIIAMLAVSRIDYHQLTHYAWFLYATSIVALIAILIVGHSAYGSTRWFNVGPIQVQPSEFAKLATILTLARFFSEHGGDARDLRALLVSLAIVVPVAFLVFIEPDLGTSLVFGAIWLGIVAIAGVSRNHLGVLACVFIAIFPFLFTFLIADYQIERISVLVDSQEDPLGAGYNVNQSKLAIGSGQLFGLGLTEGKQTNGGFLKGPTKDYAFSVAGEETGFVGCMGILLLYGFLLWRGIRAAQIAGDTAGQLIAVGIVVLILGQAFINIAVNLSLFPVTGIPLPFISQGGSSLVSLFVSLGVLQSIVMRHRAYRQT